MRKWLAGKLIDLAVWLDWDAAVQAARVVVAIDDSWKAAFAPKKRGRPVGSKDGVARKVSVVPKKRGRPVGSKNKPKVQP
jgi:hypothetical protein